MSDRINGPMKYFACDEYGEIETFLTKGEAKQRAQDYIDIHRDGCDENWGEDVDYIMWGKILGSAVRVDAKEGGVDYVLKDEYQDAITREADENKEINSNICPECEGDGRDIDRVIELCKDVTCRKCKGSGKKVETNA